ncbi:28S ribosomal protein S35, mitochondrial [Teleopsis dalmanni]|uniref:28S ribosomal protein S35, mitochondrial n=1 Tax=Teleopsis dalmanni TaxID=139649 RepID=UPI0018CFECEA|nr:28S ribosomal protein S35, mitochondrial [Teleopsis dalmanni]
MSAITRLLTKNLRNSNGSVVQIRQLSAQQESDQELHDEEFRVLNLREIKKPVQKKRVVKKQEQQPPRTTKMAIDQDWTAVWPGPRSFHPASVPLPLRQGYALKGAASPSKYANAELMKIPNFLHLTPPAIKQQCEALKKFCTPWPKGLETEEKCRKHFPIEVIHTDYCHGLPTIRHPEARRVTLKISLSDLKFDSHARDKFLRLVGERYDRETDTLTIVADRCPLRKQNYDYAIYLLTACYHESFITEPWEATKVEADMELYHFNRNVSKVSAEAILNWGNNDDANKVNASESFGKCVEDLINDGENEYSLGKYKEEVIKLLGLNKN